MDATATFSLRFARVLESKVETTDWVLSRQVLQRIATRMSLISEVIGFSLLGILIIMNRHQADLNGLAGGSAVAMVGGISAVFVATVFLVASCLHWRFCARHLAALPVRRQSQIRIQELCRSQRFPWNGTEPLGQLRRFLHCGQLELFNNLTENAIRPVAVGRKNWLHVGSERAGPRIAAILSIIETCRRLQIRLLHEKSQTDSTIRRTTLPGGLIRRRLPT